jgi:hypothetical protein
MLNFRGSKVRVNWMFILEVIEPPFASKSIIQLLLVLKASDFADRNR